MVRPSPSVNECATKAPVCSTNARKQGLVTGFKQNPDACSHTNSPRLRRGAVLLGVPPKPPPQRQRMGDSWIKWKARSSKTLLRAISMGAPKQPLARTPMKYSDCYISHESPRSASARLPATTTFPRHVSQGTWSLGRKGAPRSLERCRPESFAPKLAFGGWDFDGIWHCS